MTDRSLLECKNGNEAIHFKEVQQIDLCHKCQNRHQTEHLVPILLLHGGAYFDAVLRHSIRSDATVVGHSERSSTSSQSEWAENEVHVT